jgi:hypothetical protein
MFSGVAGVAPACALAGEFGKASAQASSGPATAGHRADFQVLGILGFLQGKE